MEDSKREARINSNEEESQQEVAFSSFDEYLATVDDTVRSLYNENITGLKSALERERADRRKLSEQVRALTPLAEKGSEVEKKLAETAKLLEEAEISSQEYQKRAIFAEQAIRPEVSCNNVRAAFALAVSENLFTQDGEPDWSKLRELAPELFKTATQTNAGDRTKGDLPSDLNAAIRRAAGIRP